VLFGGTRGVPIDFDSPLDEGIQPLVLSLLDVAIRKSFICRIEKFSERSFGDVHKMCELGMLVSPEALGCVPTR
jgi:hypothetical protein